MTEQNAQPARPLAPGPTIEEQLRKAVEDGRNSGIVRGRPAESFMPLQGVGSTFGAPKVVQELPTGKTIAAKLSRVIERLRDAEAQSGSIATTLAGPATPFRSLGESRHDTPAASLFVIYERALDEMGHIIDNIEHEQARVRDIIA